LKGNAPALGRSRIRDRLTHEQLVTTTRTGARAVKAFANMNANHTSDFDVVVMPTTPKQRRADLVVVSSVALSFISFWRAAAIVLNDMASTVYYIGGISEQAIGKAAPWFVLGVMLFAYAVRAVYVESCTMFTRGGVYRVVKEAMGAPLAKLSVSALMFDYILTGPISAVSAGQYLVGLFGNLIALTPVHFQLSADAHPDLVKLLSMLIAIGITLYFWRVNIIGIHESSQKALRIMQLTTIMGVGVILWSIFTIFLHPETRHLPPFRPVLTPESQGWLIHFPRIVGMLGIAIAFGHTLLAMSGEESLAQVYREIEAPKVRNLLKSGFVIVIYSLLLTGVVTFFAVMIIPDNERIKTTAIDGNNRVEVASVVQQKAPDGTNQRMGKLENGTTFALAPNAHILRESGKYTDNLISGLVMHLAGPHPIKLAFQAFVVLVGFLILSGAVNTSIVGSNGVLNRLAEDGILTPWFLHPQPRFGTTHRLINTVAVLQLLTIVASMGDVYTLGEAYAFGVIWSFVFKTLAMVILRFKDKSPREYEVPLNIRIPVKRKSAPERAEAEPTTVDILGRPGVPISESITANGVAPKPAIVSDLQDRIDLPIGIAAIFLILLGTALINLMTKKVATIWGIGFTAGFLMVFLISEHISHRLRKGAHHEHLEQFNEKVTDHPTPESIGLTHLDPVLVAVRNPKSMAALEKVLHETDTTRRDIVAITCKVLPPMTPGVTPQELTVDDNDREVLTRVVNLAEEAGKRVYPLMIPTNNPLYAIATAARDLDASQVVLGASEKVHTDVLMEQFAMAWGMAAGEQKPHAITLRIIGPRRETECRL
jgi:amino acid transporter/nucleotide-binding universal stress UspA family protein